MDDRVKPAFTSAMRRFAAMSRRDSLQGRRIAISQDRKDGAMTRWSMEAIRLGAGSMGIGLVSLILVSTHLLSGAMPSA